MKLSNEEVLKLKQKVDNNLKNLENQRSLLMIGFSSGLYSYFSKLKKDFEIIEQSYSFENLTEKDIMALSKKLKKLLSRTDDYGDLLNKWITQSRNVGIKQSDSFLNALNIPLEQNTGAEIIPFKNDVKFQKNYLLDKVNKYVESNILEKELPSPDNKKDKSLFNTFFEQLLNNSMPLISSLLITRYINNGLYSTYTNNPNITHHIWVTQHDQYVRPSHNAIDGEIVKIGDSFSNGCLYPCDENGDPSEIMNCRCYTLPVPTEMIT